MSNVNIGRAALVDCNLLLACGADNSYAFRYSTTESPVDLSGYTARAQVRDSEGCLVIDLTSYITLGGVLGTIVIDVPAAATQDIEALRGAWDLELISPAGAVLRFAQGRVSISQGVTHD